MLLTIGVSCGAGCFRGLVKTLFALASWLVAALGTPLVASSISVRFGWDQHPGGLWVVVFIALFVLVRVAGHALARGLQASGLGGLDRLAGTFFGLARALLIIVLVVGGARMLGADDSQSWRSALSRPLLDALVHWIDPHLPRPAGGTRMT